MTDKQKLFCEEYLLSMNATQAAMASGYSENTAAQTGSRLLKTEEIKKYIDARQKETQESLEIGQSDIIKQLADIGFANINSKAIRAMDKLKALELMAKFLGIDAPKRDNYAGRLEELISEFMEI